MTRQLICIRCPLGCPLTVELGDGRVLSIKGHTCPRGESYAKIECTAPMRTVTSSVRVEGGVFHMLPVRSAGDIPKEKIMDCMEALRDVIIKAPVTIGDVVMPDIVGTGVDMIATRNIEADWI